MILPNADPVLLFFIGSQKVPIPFYLSEKLTGVYVDTERNALSIATDTIGTKDKAKGDASNLGDLQVQQKGETQSVDITMVARRDNMGLNILLPLLKTIYDGIMAQKEYKIAYFNQNILIFNAKLSNFATDQHRTDNLMTISITLEIPPEKEEQEEEQLKLANKSKDVPR